jgi:hypothetical protein
MSAKEMKVDCPACGSHLQVDLRTERVLRFRPKGVSPGEKAPDFNWKAALERASGRGSEGTERFEQALQKEQRRSLDLDALFSRVSSGAGGQPDPRPGAATPQVGLGAGQGANRPELAEQPEQTEHWAWTLERARLASVMDSLSMAGVPWRREGEWLCWRDPLGSRAAQASPWPDPPEAARGAVASAAAGAGAPALPAEAGLLALLTSAGPAVQARLQALATAGWQLSSFEAVLCVELGLLPTGPAGRGPAGAALVEAEPGETRTWQRSLLSAWSLAPGGDLGSPMGRLRAFWWQTTATARLPVALWISAELAVLGALPAGINPGVQERIIAAARVQAAQSGCRWLVTGGGRAEGAEGGVLHLDTERGARLGFEVAYHRALFAVRPPA